MKIKTNLRVGSVVLRERAGRCALGAERLAQRRHLERAVLNHALHTLLIEAKTSGSPCALQRKFEAGNILRVQGHHDGDGDNIPQSGFVRVFFAA
jgi:hypothetical protein